MTRESESEESAQKGKGFCVVGMKAELVWLHVSDRPTSQSGSLWSLQWV